MTEITETIKELTLSLGLIQLLSDIKPIEPQEKIVEYLQTTGIPTKIEDECSLAIYIYSTLEDKLDEYSLRYINCLYIMGALERDNQIAYDEETGEPIDIANSEASPMAITCRSCISSLLGGDPAFKSLMNKAKKLSMKVILDSLARISSSRANRKYKNILLHYLEPNGKVQICYGIDGHSVHYEVFVLLSIWLELRAQSLFQII